MATEIDNDGSQAETFGEIDCLFCLKAKDETLQLRQARPKRFSLWKRSVKKPTADTQPAEIEHEASTPNEPLVIPFKKLKSTGVEIGRGAYGRVFEVEYGKIRCAAKEVHPLLLEAAAGQGNALENIKANFLHECQIWSLLQHPRIVKIIALPEAEADTASSEATVEQHDTEEQPIHTEEVAATHISGIYYPEKDKFKVPVIVMEKMQFSMRGLVENYGHLPLNKTMTILHDVCLGLQYLHCRTPPIVHRDLTPNNILLCYHLRAKITDLGVARTLKATDAKAMTQAPGTHDFMSPECLVENPVYGLPLDIFSFGGVILYITTQEWPHPSPQMTIRLTSELHRRQQYLKKMAGNFECLKPLVISCLEDNPNSRPTVSKVLAEIKEIMKSYKALEDEYSDIMFGEEEEVNGSESPKQLEELPPDQTERKKQQHQLQSQGQKQQRIMQQEQQTQSKVQVQPEQQRLSLVEGKHIKEAFKANLVKINFFTDSDDSSIDGELSNEATLQIVSKAHSQITTSNSVAKSSLVPVYISQTNTEPTYPIFIAKYDFVSEKDELLSFNKGDLLYIINKEGEWWYARAKRSDQEGYIPQDSVADPNSLDANDWYFGAITRKHAENLLMQPFNDCGSFLIRNSESTPGDYSLSVKFVNQVRHYRIEHSSSGYCISNLIFGSISKLIAHHSKSPSGLCINLKKPCLTTIARSQTASTSSEEIIETWEVDRSSIQFVKKLGSGDFSEVWLGNWNDTTKIVVKELKPGVVSANEFSQAVALMTQLIHPQVVQLYAVCAQEEPIYIITELMKHGSLLEYLRGDGHSLKLPQLIDMGKQVADGMAYLEKKNYVHRDLAARNILVTENLICKVKAITMARVLSNDIYNACTKAKFLSKWTAPEAAMYKCFTIKSDVWSFGIVLYELITYGHPPYPGISNMEALTAIKLGYRMPCPEGCPEQLYNIMRDCWRDNAATRPTFESLHWRIEMFYLENEPTHLCLQEIRSTFITTY